MKKLHIYLLKKKDYRALDSFIREEILQKKVNNDKLEQEEEALCIYNLDKDFLRDNEISGKVYIYKQPVKRNLWLDDINGLTEKNINVEDMEYLYKVLIILNHNNNYYAISYSRGYTLLKDYIIVNDFGLLIAQKKLKREHLKSIQNFSIGQTLRHQSIYSSMYLKDPLGDSFKTSSVLKQLSGDIKIMVKVGAVLKELNLSVEGRDSVVISGYINLRTDIIPIVDSLQTIYFDESLEKNIVIENELIELKKITDKNNCEIMLIDKLKEIYSKYINQNNEVRYKDIKKITLELSLKGVDTENLKFRFNGSNKWFYNFNDSKEDIFSELCFLIRKENKKDDIKKFLKNKKVFLKNKFSEEFEEIKYIRLYNAIYYEASKKEYTYFLLQGRWYKLDKSIYSNVKNIVNNISSSNKGINFDKYKPDEDKTEAGYNERIPTLVDNLSEVFTLDKELYKPQKIFDLNNRSAVEACDLIKVKQSELILCHIKRGHSGSGVSHLIAQALASSNLFLKDPKFIEHINDSLPEGTLVTECNKKQTHIILGCIVDKKSVHLNNSTVFPILFNISLANLYVELKSMGFEISLVKIPSE